MADEIPQNEERTVDVTIPKSKLFDFIEALDSDRNVIKVSHTRSGSNVTVTVHYAIMDLAIQLSSVRNSIEQKAQAVRA